jgi:hypothetical protein
MRRLSLRTGGTFPDHPGGKRMGLKSLQREGRQRPNVPDAMNR